MWGAAPQHGVTTTWECDAVTVYPPMLGYGSDGNLLPLSIPIFHLGKQAHPMMYARTMSWISRKVSPTFLFRTSTMRGVSYSKRNEDSLSMHRCPMATPGLCRWPQCLPPPRGLGCACRHSSVCRGIKVKINRMIRIKKMLSVVLCAQPGCQASSSAQRRVFLFL